MLPLVLIALGVFFVILGVAKKTGFTDPDFNEKAATGFFIYGFFLITFSIFLFNAPTPYGEMTTKNVSYTYYPENLTVYSYDDVGNYQGFENRTVMIVNTTSEAYSYSTSEGPSVANLIFYINGILGLLWAILWALQLLKSAFTRKKSV